MAGNWGDKTCSCNIIDYFKALDTTINILKPTSFVIFGWVFTRNDNSNNANLTKLKPFKVFFEMSAAKNDKKKHKHYLQLF